MDEVIAFIIGVFLVVMNVLGIYFSVSLLSGDRFVKNDWAVQRGYAEYIPNATNGTMRFEWIDLNKGE